jgi:hypothetical protein
MRKAEIVLAIATIISICMYLFLIPGGSLLTFLSLQLLSTFYALFGIALFNNAGFTNMFNKNSYKESSPRRIVGAISVGLALSGTLLGVFFIFRSYKGGRELLFNGLIALLVAIIIGAIRYFKTKSKYYRNIFYRVIVIGGFGLLMILIPKIKILEFRFRDYPYYIETLKKAFKEPKNKELWENVEKERNKITNEGN